jgi:hypothetical protein
VEVVVSGPGADTLLAELLGGFPEGDLAAAPDLTIALGPAVGPPEVGGRPMFFHGLVQAREVDGAILLTDGASTARVAPDGQRIDLAVAEASLADRHLFEHVLVLLALVVALRHHGLFHLHAAALVRPDGRSILVAGSAGVGKSTLALALLDGEPSLGWLGDDAVFLARRTDGVRVLALPRLFHLSDRTAAAFPHLGPALGPHYGGGPKRRLAAGLAFPGRSRLDAAAPAAVLLPQVVDQPGTELEVVTAAEALGALIESGALLVVDGMPAVNAHLALLAAAVNGATCLNVRLGRDLLERPGEVGEGVLRDLA